MNANIRIGTKSFRRAIFGLAYTCDIDSLSYISDTDVRLCKFIVDGEPMLHRAWDNVPFYINDKKYSYRDFIIFLSNYGDRYDNITCFRDYFNSSFASARSSNTVGVKESYILTILNVNDVEDQLISMVDVEVGKLDEDLKSLLKELFTPTIIMTGKLNLAHKLCDGVSMAHCKYFSVDYLGRMLLFSDLEKNSYNLVHFEYCVAKSILTVRISDFEKYRGLITKYKVLGIL